ncbi:MAG TPA: hypothetical protein VFA49_05330 [Chloroflexota bacterium]|nr:hypothetical protein [Chloroflexota bacterium]
MYVQRVARSTLNGPSPMAEPDASGRSPARVVGGLVGIVAILLLGSLFWSGLGALVSAFGDAKSSFPTATTDRTEHFLAPATAAANPANPIRVTPTPLPTLVPVAAPAAPAGTAEALPTAARPSPTAQPTTEPTPDASPTPNASPTAEPTPDSTDRAPWVLLPLPAPGARVPPGPVLVEARGRGDAPIAQIRLELDGNALPVAVEQRSDSIWRGSTTAQVGPGKHAVRALVVDAQGRTGSYRWSFDAN